MTEIFQYSEYISLFLCIFTYGITALIAKKRAIKWLNPLLVSSLICIIFLLTFNIDYHYFQKGTRLISLLLTPATVSLAVPLYRRRELLYRYWFVILCGIAVGSFSSMAFMWVISKVFSLSHEVYITFLPKSVTTAIGMDLVKEFKGITSLTAATIIVTGIVGSLMYPLVCRFWHITHPVAKGLAVGVSSHAMGTNVLLLEDEKAGAISSLAIVLSGLFTALYMNFFAYFF